MKLSKSKLALAKVINENGGWVDGTMQLATSNKNGSVYLWSNTPRRIRHVWDFGGRFTALRGDWRKLPDWHQTILSREEYYQAYPKADADEWIEWNGGECPVGKNVTGDIKLACGEKFDTTDMAMWNWHLGNGHPRSIIAYRLHKPEVKPEFCESVMRSIPEPEEKPTIEKLAQDYRNAKDHADRLQKEADEAKDKSEAIKELLIKSGAEIGAVISIGKAGDEIEYKIGDKWFLVSDLK